MSHFRKKFVRSRFLIYSATILMTLLLLLDWAHAESEAAAIVRVASGGQAELVHDFLPLSKDEAHYFTMKDGVVIGESSIPKGEDADVIVQLKGAPLDLLKNISRISADAAAADLEKTHFAIKEEIVRLDGQMRAAKGFLPRSPEKIIKHQYQHIFNGIAAKVSRDALKQIESLPEVQKIWPDVKLQLLLNESVPLIEGDRVWGNLGATGHGISVAIIDTGIDYTHPALGGCLGPRCKVIGGYNYTNNGRGTNNPMDDHGHGTHVAGIVAANGSVKGVAPDAKLLAYKVAGPGDTIEASAAIAATERAFMEGARVINMSFGGSGSPDDPMSQAVDNTVAAGVLVVIAAGNTGPSYGTVSSPGVAREAFTVGASDKNNVITNFSSRGPANVTFQIKPEVLAPGASITSTVPRGTCSLCDASGFQTLSGTSMAAPHVAGAAALLLERFPTWTPGQVKEALMEKSVNLSYNVFTQGNGRIDAYASATLSGLVNPGNLSLGLDDISQPTFSGSEPLHLTNLTTDPQTYNLSIQGAFPPGMSAAVSPPTLILAPGETKSFTFNLDVDNTLVPNSSNAPYDYEGTVVVAGNGETLTLPFAFFKTPVLELTFDEAPFVVIVIGKDFFQSLLNPGILNTIPIPQGTYDVITLYEDMATRVLREGVAITDTTALNIAKAEAIYPLTIVPIDENGNPLTLTRGITIGSFKHKSSSFSDGVISFPVLNTFRFSSMSDAYLFELSIFEDSNRPMGPKYTFHGYARAGINSPITFQNSPSDFKKAITRYHVNPGVTGIHPMTHYGFPGLMAGEVHYDPLLRAPFEEVSYYLPIPYPEFALGYLQKSVYLNPTDAGQFKNLVYKTPNLRVADRSTVEGCFWVWNSSSGIFEAAPVISNTSDIMPVGIGPYSWFGRFTNNSNEIQLRAAVGNYIWLFLGQTRDVRPHKSLPYQLYQNGNLVQNGVLSDSWVGDPSVSSNYASIYAPPGAYTLRIPYSDFHIGDQQGLAWVDADFDTRKSDPNPPYMTEFNVADQAGNITDEVSENGRVLFTVFDDFGVAEVDLFYNNGAGWQQLTVTDLGSGKYSAGLPSFDSGVSLNLFAVDTSGNSLRYTTAKLTACSRPFITSQPQSQPIQNGQTAMLSVMAYGTTPFIYQWYQGQSRDTSTPVGTNSDSFTTPALTQTTSYWVRVSNFCGSSDSTGATITISGIHIVSPNGEETFTASSTQTIEWSYEGSPGSYVKIELLKGGVVTKVISALTRIGSGGSGSYNWPIPSTQVSGSDYQIRITSTTNAAYTDTSDGNFTIVGPPPPTIFVTSPNGGETWAAGSTQTIQWSYGGNPGSYVKIELLKGGVVTKVISNLARIGTGGSGSYNWVIPSTQTTGSDYQIKITSTNNAAYTDTSDGNFTIVAPSLTLTSPNGGETWAPGATQIIGWTFTGGPGTYLKIELLKAGILNRTITSLALTNKGSYSWRIPATQLPAADYSIRITSRTNPSWTDTSDSDFTIGP
jgi:subtilisin family serine protease